MNENINDYEEVKLFGKDIDVIYAFDLNTAYDFVNKNTNYLENITIDEVQEIKFSYYKDIIILLKNGVLIVNGEETSHNIKTLGIDGGMYVFSISNDNIITCLTGNWKTTQFINNHDYKYKKIVMVGLGVAALTHEGTIKYFGTFVDGFIDYTNFYDVEDIGYVEENEDIAIVKKDKIISLFTNEDYRNEDVLLEGTGERFVIIR